MAHDNDSLAPVPPTRYRRADGIARAQVLLPFLAVGGMVLYGVMGLLPGGATRYSPKPLALAHSSWDHSCAACHVSAAPLDGDNWLAQLTGQRRAADEQCLACHAVPPHHASARAAAVPGCANCHREHRGVDNALTRVADGQCLSCHRSLADYRDGSGSVQDVSGFSAATHPEFRLLSEKGKDPGTIAFNHALHLAPGLRTGEGAAPFTLGDIPLVFRARYQTLPEQASQDRAASAPVQLQCASCHRVAADGRPVGREMLDAGRGTRSDGTSMAPIVFEQHCQACHPLTFAPAPKNDAKAEPAAVAHRLQPSEIRTWLRGYFIGTLDKDKKSPLQKPLRPLPGRNPERDDESRKLHDLLEPRIRLAETILYGPSTCQKCHTSLDPHQGADQRVEPAAIPRQWFQQARFDHTAHRFVDCRECHAQAETSTNRGDVMLPGIATCIKCHSPPHSVGGQPRGGARYDCAECHRYHGGDQALHGRGGP
jgi:hypothetical protein